MSQSTDVERMLERTLAVEIEQASAGVSAAMARTIAHQLAVNGWRKVAADPERKLQHQTAFIVYKILLRGPRHEVYTSDVIEALRIDYARTMRECGIPT